MDIKNNEKSFHIAASEENSSLRCKRSEKRFGCCGNIYRFFRQHYQPFGNGALRRAGGKGRHKGRRTYD